ncbi:hypothetical protein Q9L58_010123 [Maublancomyces gigas]|uniref:Uncharacterized protein n=1 Tax=Discina gigas TaxID=1032678 RepID=A0ABR3G5C8_9PEZI
MKTPEWSGAKVPRFVKQPDAYFAVRDGGMSVFPLVVFEVAFSQSYEEVRADVYQCLERTDGAVQLALLFAITEHPIVRPAGHDSATSDSHASSPGSYRHLRATFAGDEYVGALSAFAEVYPFDRAKGGCARLSAGPITDILPDIYDGGTIRLDLAIYSRALLNARKKMVLPCLLDKRRTSRKLQVATAAPDPEYRPSGSRVV